MWHRQDVPPVPCTQEGQGLLTLPVVEEWWSGRSTSGFLHEGVSLFSAVSSPACANFGLKYLAHENKLTHPVGSQLMSRDVYVDKHRWRCYPAGTGSTGNMCQRRLNLNSQSVLVSMTASDLASISTLGHLNNDSRRFHTFVANRVHLLYSDCTFKVSTINCLLPVLLISSSIHALFVSTKIIHVLRCSSLCFMLCCEVQVIYIKQLHECSLHVPALTVNCQVDWQSTEVYCIHLSTITSKQIQTGC